MAGAEKEKCWLNREVEPSEAAASIGAILFFLVSMIVLQVVRARFDMPWVRGLQAVMYPVAWIAVFPLIRLIARRCTVRRKPQP
jgi:hypothetical protein